MERASSTWLEGRLNLRPVRVALRDIHFKQTAQMVPSLEGQQMGATRQRLMETFLLSSISSLSSLITAACRHSLLSE